MKRKTKKAKPEIVWMPWHDEAGFTPMYWNATEEAVQHTLTYELAMEWKDIYRRGWRIKRVKISEV